MSLYYLRGQDGWRHLITKVRLRGDLGLGATSALCYAAATHHRVYILKAEDKQHLKKNPKPSVTFLYCK